MPARTNCCGFFNLMKMDPTTGASIWKVVVDGDGSYGATTKLNQAVWFVEPLRGTNDVLVGVAYHGTKASICRVDETGAQLWFYNLNGFTSWPNLGRMFGSDGSVIVAGSASSLVGLDYNGNFLWTVSNTNPYALAVSPGQVTCNMNVSPYQRTYDISNGSLIHSGTVFYSRRNADAVQQSTGRIYIGGDALSSYVLDSHTFAPVAVSSPAYAANRCRWGASGISQVFAGAVQLLSPSLARIWSITSVAGYPVGTPADTDNDATGTYFCGQSLTAAQVQVWKLDATGAVVWGDGKFGVGNTATGANAIAVADNGYLYVGGQYGSY